MYMSITIKDCLNLPSLSLGKVIAGKKGLDNIVTTISVLEFNDTDDPDITTPNELLISALYCVKDDVDAQCRLIEKAKRSGDVGLILFYSDAVLASVDEKVIKIADFLHFPIILMPEKDMGLKYSDVISDVMEAIFMDRKAKNYFVSDTTYRLSQSPEKDRTPYMVLRLASNYAKASFFLCDHKENLIAASFWPVANHMDFNEVQILYKHHDDPSLRTYRVDFSDKNGTQLALYTVTQNTRLNTSILNEVVEVIQLFSLLWNYNLDLHSPEALLPPLLEGDLERVEFICKKNNVDLTRYNELQILQTPADAPITAKRMRDIFAELKIPCVLDSFGNYTVALYENVDPVKNSMLDIDLQSYMLSEKVTPFSSVLHSNNMVEDAPSFYQMFTSNIGSLKKIYPRKEIFNYSDILFVNRVLSIFTSVDRDSKYYTDLLAPLVKDSDTELLPTLLTYLLDANAEVKATSEMLFVHRNTVLYRLNKIRSLLNCNLNDLPQSYDIYVAAAIKRL